MNMTREEAIKVLKNGGIKVCGEADRISEFIAALDVALDALIPPTRENELEAENIELKERIVNWRNYMAPTREQVEKSWAGCEYCEKHKINLVRIEMNYDDSPGSTERLNPTRAPKFCPICGRPLTDEAVDMMLQRWKGAANEH